MKGKTFVIVFVLAICIFLLVFFNGNKESEPNEILEQNVLEEPKLVNNDNDKEDEQPKKEEVILEPSNSEPVISSGLDNTRVGWSFGSIATRSAELCEKYDGIYASNKQDKSLYLTFDEGYENGYTGQILDVLKENNVPAAFFITGPYLEGQFDLVKRMVDEGHVVGNHTYDHPSLPDWNDEKIVADIKKLETLYNEKIGGSMKFLRPPKGDFSERTMALTQSLGYTTVFWKFAYADWDPNNQKGTEFAYQTVTSKVKDGDIILLHAVSKDNANALDSIIKYFKEQGYTFKSLTEF